MSADSGTAVPNISDASRRSNHSTAQTSSRTLHRHRLRPRLHSRRPRHLGFARGCRTFCTILPGFLLVWRIRYVLMFGSATSLVPDPILDPFAWALRHSLIALRGRLVWPLALLNSWPRKILNCVVIDEVSGQSVTLLLGQVSTDLFKHPQIYDAWLSSGGHRSRSTGNICSWVLYFFAFSISGSRSQPDKPSPFPAAGVSWLTTGSQAFTPQSAFGSPAQLAFESVAPVFRPAGFL